MKLGLSRPALTRRSSDNVTRLNRRVRFAIAGVGTIAIVAFGLFLIHSSNQAQHELEARSYARTVIASQFVSEWVRDFAKSERRIAEIDMQGKQNRQQRFEQSVRRLGSEAAVMLDSRGTLLAVVPYRRELIGSNMAAKYPHLATAAAGKVATSNVVPSAVDKLPVVAIATPFRLNGRRAAYSLAYNIDNIPLSSILKNVTPIRGADTFLIDGKSDVIASNRASLRGDVLGSGRTDEALKRALTGKNGFGVVDGNFYSVQRVPGMQWRLATRVPTSALYEPLPARWVGLGIFALFFLLGVVVCVLVDRLLSGRRKLAMLANTDVVTDLPNRRTTSKVLDSTIANRKPTDRVAAILMIDIDNFKLVNDEYGHAMGDAVLREIADRMAYGLREGDTVGRWGGEEFLAVLADTTLEEAQVVAERVRSAVESTSVCWADNCIDVTVSVGCSQWDGEPAEAFIDRADGALYRAKELGRNMVVTA